MHSHPESISVFPNDCKAKFTYSVLFKRVPSTSTRLPSASTRQFFGYHLYASEKRLSRLRRYNSRGMAERNHHGIDCRNKVSDAHEIQIPSPKLLKEFVARSEKRRQIVAANLLCPHCKHVFDYTARDVHPLYLIAGPLKSEPVSVAVQFLCGDGGCKSQLTVHVLKKYKNEEPSTAILRLASAIFHIRCEFGHIPRFDYRNVVHAERTRQFFPF